VAEAVLCGLIGAGIQRSLAPALHEEEARHHGLRLHYQLVDLASGGVGVETLPGLLQAVRIIGFRGLNITFPCKQSVIPLLDALSEEARTIGAVNTVVREGDRLVGYNTDASGWTWGFRRALPQRRNRRHALIGAGMTGRAMIAEDCRPVRRLRERGNREAGDENDRPKSHDHSPQDVRHEPKCTNTEDTARTTRRHTGQPFQETVRRRFQAFVTSVFSVLELLDKCLLHQFTDHMQQRPMDFLHAWR